MISFPQTGCPDTPDVPYLASDLKILTNRECVAENPVGNTSESMLCSYHESKSTCFGDSGGSKKWENNVRKDLFEKV